METPPAPSQLRVSLLSLLLLTACIAAGITIWQLNQRISSLLRTNGWLHMERDRLTKEVGDFVVADPDRLYADQIRQDITAAMENRYWAWRVWVPEGRRYLLHYGDGVISLGKLPTPVYNEPIESGDQIIQLWYVFDATLKPSGGWRSHLSIRRRTAGFDQQQFITGARSSWLEVGAGSPDQAPLFQPDRGVGLGFGTVKGDGSQDAGVQVVLQQMRVQSVPRTDKGYQGYDKIPNFDPEADAPGFVIWLEPTN